MGLKYYCSNILFYSNFFNVLVHISNLNILVWNCKSKFFPVSLSSHMIYKLWFYQPPSHHMLSFTTWISTSLMFRSQDRPLVLRCGCRSAPLNNFKGMKEIFHGLYPNFFLVMPDFNESIFTDGNTQFCNTYVNSILFHLLSY